MHLDKAIRDGITTRFRTTVYRTSWYSFLSSIFVQLATCECRSEHFAQPLCQSTVTSTWRRQCQTPLAIPATRNDTNVLIGITTSYRTCQWDSASRQGNTTRYYDKMLKDSLSNILVQLSIKHLCAACDTRMPKGALCHNHYIKALLQALDEDSAEHL